MIDVKSYGEMRMRKIGLLCSVALITMGLAGCGSSSSSTKSSSSSNKSTSSKVDKKHSSKKRSSNKNNDSSSQSLSSQSATQQSNTITQQQGNSLVGNNAGQRYDPNGSPLLPGQNHAAGSNPDGSPDPWVQWQIDHQNDTTFPDGTPFPNGGNTNN
jgi:hypothetical protein|nr:MAG TPA: lipoprotein [Caudoviricetes sp.]